MKALTLTPPWGTLVAVGQKTIETRSWPTWHRGPLAIHQAKGAGPIGGDPGLTRLVEREPFARCLRPHLSGSTAKEQAADLPRGAIVAVAMLLDVLPTTEVWQRVWAHELRRELEEAFGDYTAGRYAWVFGRTIRLETPIVCRGMQGLWDVPEDVRAELAVITDMAWTAAELEEQGG